MRMTFREENVLDFGLYQGTPLVVPPLIERHLGFSPCRSSLEPNTLVSIASELAFRSGLAVAGAKALIIPG
jgi:hypothetical protein